MKPSRKVDFIIVYEHWQRELYGDTLLKLELEKRGYSVVIENMSIMTELSWKRDYYEPSVVIYPWIYTDLDVMRALDFRGQVKHIVNLQSEQILSRYTTGRYIKFAVGEARKAYHICWGALSEKRFLESQVNAAHIRKCGNINLDINLPQYASIFEGRREKAVKYGLDENKSWVMFFSSFKDSEFVCSATSNKINEKALIWSNILTDAKREILAWFEQYLINNQDYIFIYRPHPGENVFEDIQLQNLIKTYKNFRIVPDGIIQEWIQVCDRFLTYISTSLSDVCKAGKKGALIRPVEVPEYYEADTYFRCNKITEYEELHDFLKERSSIHSLSHQDFQNVIEQMESETTAFVRVADWMEEIYHKEPEDFNNFHYRTEKSLKHQIKSNLLFRKGSCTRKRLNTLFLKSYYRKSERKDLSRKDWIPKLLGMRTFSENHVMFQREKELDIRLKKIMENVSI